MSGGVKGARIGRCAPFVTRLNLLISGIALASASCGQPDTPEGRVVIEAFVYRPAELGAAAGGSIVWVNEDVVPHTASAEDGSWDTGEIAPGDSVRIAVSGGGEQPFTCLYHPAMRGKLNVR